MITQSGGVNKSGGGGFFKKIGSAIGRKLFGTRAVGKGQPSSGLGHIAGQRSSQPSGGSSLSERRPTKGGISSATLNSVLTKAGEAILSAAASIAWGNDQGTELLDKDLAALREQKANVDAARQNVKFSNIGARVKLYKKSRELSSMEKKIDKVLAKRTDSMEARNRLIDGLKTLDTYITEALKRNASPDPKIAIASPESMRKIASDCASILRDVKRSKDALAGTDAGTDQTARLRAKIQSLKNQVGCFNTISGGVGDLLDGKVAALNSLGSALKELE